MAALNRASIPLWVEHVIAFSELLLWKCNNIFIIYKMNYVSFMQRRENQFVMNF